jgi:hypothetical protein
MSTNLRMIISFIANNYQLQWYLLENRDKGGLSRVSIYQRVLFTSPQTRHKMRMICNSRLFVSSNFKCGPADLKDGN